jgi:hypothetical protein
MKLFINSRDLFIRNVVFKCYSIGSEFTKIGYENDKLFF